MRYTAVAIALVYVGAEIAHAQRPDSLLIGDCDRATETTYLDAGNVRALIQNNGMLFKFGDYEVPKGSGIGSEYVANLVIGGMIDQDLRVAGTSYGPPEFWTGPIDENGMPPLDCTRYDQFWEVSRSRDIEYASATSRLTDNVLNWPVELGAPFIDANNNGIYDPTAGDRPRLLGDQMIWWIMNDRGSEHRRYKSVPLGLEVRASAYAYNSGGTLGTSTFFRYEITNRNEAPIDSFFIAWYRDAALRIFTDDYLGSDTTLALGYSYNADNDDTAWNTGYGPSPPANGFFLSNSDECLTRYRNLALDKLPRCWDKDLSVHLRFQDCCGTGSEPDSAVGWHNFMNGLWRDGAPISDAAYFGGRHAPSNVRFMYPGDSVNGKGWTEFSLDARGQPNQPNDRKSIGGARGDPLQSGETVVVTFALVWSRGNSNLDSVRKLKEDVAVLKRAADILVTPRLKVQTPIPQQFEFSLSMYPNPANGFSTIQFSLPKSMDVRFSYFDALGREVYSVDKGSLPPGEHEQRISTSSLAAGLYLVRIQFDHFTVTRSVVEL